MSHGELDLESKIFFSGGIRALILRELQKVLTPMVLGRLAALEQSKPGWDWWKHGVLPYLNNGDMRDLLISCFGEEVGKQKALGEADHVTSAKGKGWFAAGGHKKTPKSKDVGFLLRYMMSRPAGGGGPRGWQLLFEPYGSYPRKELEFFYAFRNESAHPSWDVLTQPDQIKEDINQAIENADRLFTLLQLPDHKHAIRGLKVNRLVRQLDELLEPDFVSGGHLTNPKIQYRTVADLADAYRNRDIVVLHPKTQHVTVTGTFAPRLLLARFRSLHKAQRQRPEDYDRFWKRGWHTDLQRWLFRGFVDWAPSWDPRVSGRSRRNKLVGQLASGDEGDSFCVVLRGRHVKTASELLKKYPWGGKEYRESGSGCFDVRVTGRLFYQMDVLPGLLAQGTNLACLVVDDDGGFEFRRKTESYTGYLWKCIAPVEWFPNRGDGADGATS